MRAGDRKGQKDAKAAVAGAAKRNACAHRIREVLDEGEADSRPARGLDMGGVSPVKGFEESFAARGCDAWPLVAHFEPHALSLAMTADCDLSSGCGARVFERVVD